MVSFRKHYSERSEIKNSLDKYPNFISVLQKK